MFMSHNSHVYRLEIFPNAYQLNERKVQEAGLISWFQKYMDVKVDRVWEIRTFLVEVKSILPGFLQCAEEVFLDSVLETLVTEETDQKIVLDWLTSRGFKKPMLIDIGFRPGVTDNSAHAALEALKLIPALSNVEMKVSSGSMVFIEGDGLDESLLTKMAYEKLANTLLHKVSIFKTSPEARMKDIKFPSVDITAANSQNIDLHVSAEELQKMNQENCWALSAEELAHIKKHYEEIKRNPTDVEMEIIAQSWSEHCKHKIFSSEITYSESKNLPAGVKPLGDLKINGIFKSYIRGATKRIQEERKIPWLISIFHDNAGIVRFDDKVDVCIKVETHNSPSALDPYGGALTGILGVNRDILGVGLGAKPIANTNVFCLAENDYFKENNIDLPLLLKNPDRIKEGVHLGVQDGGNKSGIPTVNGAFIFDRDYVGKPLVYCGTIGVMPQIENGQNTCDKGQRPGDLIVMAGGRIGKDGIHGATFSSMELVDGVPSSVVQIGDPITQKRLGDFLVEARKRGLFNSVTDNGAGGLSSSIGEMAQKTNGAVVDLEKALVKYPGLSPFELMVSESQERMTFSVTNEKIAAFLELAKSRSVEASVIGEFTESGFLNVRYEGAVVANLSMHFLHESLIPMKLNANFNMQTASAHWIQKNIPKLKIADKKYSEVLFSLLRSPNVRSHEHLVRRYDHEVKAATIVKPYTGTPEVGFSAPTDAGVIWMKPHGGGEDNALAISCGANPKISQYDSYAMAEYAVDEAVRNAVCVGANPDEMVLVDNYCWPDPIPSAKNPDAELKLSHLVRSSKALYDVSVDYGMPFVSGKDSMKNDFIGKRKDGSTVKISVPPTLLITAMGRVPSLKCVTTSEVKKAGSELYLIGNDLTEYHSAFEVEGQFDYKIEYPLPPLDSKAQLEIYRKLHTCMKEKLILSSHDISDGGLLVSVVEKIMGTTFGCDIDLSTIPENKLFEFFFNEGPGRLVVSVLPENAVKFKAHMSGTKIGIRKLGVVTDNGIIKAGELKVTGAECLSHYKYLVDKNL
jgi:phosphoribosylformylglycinamidine synthase II